MMLTRLILAYRALRPEGQAGLALSPTVAAAWFAPLEQGLFFWLLGSSLLLTGLGAALRCYPRLRPEGGDVA